MLSCNSHILLFYSYLPNIIAVSLQVKDICFLLLVFPMVLSCYIHGKIVVKFSNSDISLHRAGMKKWKCQFLSRVQLFVIPWTEAYQAPLSMEFSRQEYWSGLQCPSPEDPPNPGIEPRSPALAGRFFTIWATREAPRAGMVLGQKRAKPNNGPWEICHQQMGKKTEWGFQHLSNQSSFSHLLIIYSTMTYEHLFMVLSIRGTKMALKFWTHMDSKSFQIIFSQPFP